VYIRNDWTDRKKSIACRNAIQSCTSDIAPPEFLKLAAQCRTGHNVRRCGCPASAEAGVRRSPVCSASQFFSAVHGHYLGSRVAGIFCRTRKCLLLWQTLSRLCGLPTSPRRRVRRTGVRTPRTTGCGLSRDQARCVSTACSRKRALHRPIPAEQRVDIGLGQAGSCFGSHSRRSGLCRPTWNRTAELRSCHTS